MTLDELREVVTDDYVGREDCSAAQIDRALKWAHDRIQRLKDWRAQETITPALVYPSDNGGLEVDLPNCKRIFHVYERFEDDDGRIKLRTIQDTSEYEADRARLAEEDIRIQRWYEGARRIHLIAQPDEDVRLVVKYYRLLSFYVDGADSDWFSDQASDALLAGAAHYLARAKLEDERSRLFLAEFQQLVVEAYATDSDAKRAGLARAYSPPLPWQHRRGFAGTAAVAGADVSVPDAQEAECVDVRAEVTITVASGTDTATVAVPGILSTDYVLFAQPTVGPDVSHYQINQGAEQLTVFLRGLANLGAVTLEALVLIPVAQQ